MSTSPNMGLTIPTVSTTPGPTYASNINDDLTIIDGHTHEAGSGVQITPSAININGDLDFNSNDATELRTTRFFQFSDSGTSWEGTVADRCCLYSNNQNLIWINGDGTDVPITNGNSLDLSSVVNLYIADTEFNIVSATLGVQYRAQFSCANLPVLTVDPHIFYFPAAATDDTLVCEGTTQTLVNKTLTKPRMTNLTTDGITTVTFPSSAGTVVYNANTATLSNKTLTTPTIAVIKTNSGATSLTLPTAVGTSGQALVDTTGTGVLGFQTISATYTETYVAVTGATITNLTSSYSVVILTGSVATTISTISAGVAGQPLTIINDTSVNITFTFSSGVGTNRILTPNSQDYVLAPNGSTVSLYYSSASGFWWVDANSYVPGCTSGSAVPDYMVGQVVSSAVGPISVANNTVVNLTSINIPAGEWDVYAGFVLISDTVTSGSNMKAEISINTLSNGLGGVFGATRGSSTFYTTSTVIEYTSTLMTNLSLSTQTTYYANIRQVIGPSTATCSGYVYFYARRSA